MKAIILAAGTGSRLRPLTDHVPKCLVELKGKPLLDYQLQSLRTLALEKIAIVCGYKHEALAPYKLQSYRNDQFESTNMVYSLFCARAEFDQDLLITYGDVIFEPRVISHLASCKSDFAIAIDSGWRELWNARMEDPLADAESLRLDPDGNIIDIGRKVTSYNEIEGQYTGLIRISKEGLRKICNLYDSLDRNALYEGKVFNSMFMTTFIQLLIANGEKIAAVPIKHGWLEVDSEADIASYQSLPYELFDFSAFQARYLPVDSR